ncbi:MAG TPA: hypothetical protein VLE48_10105 [Terriglobales bacterium]|nr:hypothetical protein [Terriglobales bacterium]
MIEAMESLGLVFNALREMRNIARHTEYSTKNELGEAETGTKGLKSKHIAKKTPAHTDLCTRAACTETTAAPAQTNQAAAKVQLLEDERHRIARTSNAAMQIHFTTFVRIETSWFQGREGGTCPPPI